MQGGVTLSWYIIAVMLCSPFYLTGMGGKELLFDEASLTGVSALCQDTSHGSISFDPKGFDQACSSFSLTPGFKTPLMTIQHAAQQAQTACHTHYTLPQLTSYAGNIKGCIYEFLVALFARTSEEVKGFNLEVMLQAPHECASAQYDVVTQSSLIECKARRDWREVDKVKRQLTQQKKALHLAGTMNRLVALAPKQTYVQQDSAGTWVLRIGDYTFSCSWLPHFLTMEQGAITAHTIKHHLINLLRMVATKELILYSKHHIPNNLYNFLSQHSIGFFQTGNITLNQPLNDDGKLS